MRGLLLTTVAIVAACSGDGQTSSEQDTELDDDFQGCPPEIPAFGQGLEAKGSQYTLKLLSAQPTQPERYENNWTVEVSPPDAQLVRGQTFMPIHGHDGRVEPQLRPLAQAGQFAVDRLSFTMRGPWEVRLWLHSDALAEDYVVFHVCVAK